ncbi:MAG TPA: glycosyl hydrolase, partial [Opitutus sp.]|nr:glycosyl hydrolase [Opitutus sp.]
MIFRKKSLSLVLRCLVFAFLSATAKTHELATMFAQPPDEARARVWWHWVDGNVSKEGITADLEAMQRVGIGGAWIFNVSQSLPEGPAPFLSSTWLRMLDHAVEEADRLGLELGIHNSDGWSESGGPWITPEVSMKKLTWSETTVRGSGRKQLKLPQPEALMNFYREVAVLAVPAPRNDTAQKPSAIRTSFPLNEPQVLSDERENTAVSIPATAEADAQWIELDYEQPLVARALTLTTPELRYGVGKPPPSAQLEAWSGTGWEQIKEFNIRWSVDSSPVKATTVAFDAVRAERFRITFFDLPAFELADIQLSEEPRVDYWQLKAGWIQVKEHGGETDYISARDVVRDNDGAAVAPKLTDVINLSSSMADDGALEWDVPEGEWVIYRIGLTTTGRTNRPATPTGKGLECDKLSRKGIDAHFPHYAGRLAETYGPRAGRALRVVGTDSWEAGLQNWTEDLPQEFRARRGYDIIPWLPLLLSGRAFESSAASERVLWDFRRTLADMIRENYFEAFRELSHASGLTYWGESAGRTQYMYDPLNYQSAHDRPMGEFWVNQKLRPDNRAAASVAHTYGRPIVTAEAYTAQPADGRWTNDPFRLKAQGDLAFCAGVNALTLHRYAHQPWMHVAPGLTMGRWGTMFDRTNTWWEMSRPWFDYLARAQYLLRQGEFVADVCHYIGEDVPNFIGHREDLWLPLPAGVDYDGCNDEILRRFTVRNGRLVLPHGQSYAVLLLPESRTMRPDSLRVIRDLIYAGATVIGRRPLRSPSFLDLGAGDAELQRLVDELWGPAPSDRTSLRHVGAGRMLSVPAEGATWEEIARLLDFRPDFEAQPSTPANIHYIHRRVEDRDIYFVATDAAQSCTAITRFRITGKRPQLWNPQTGEIRPLPEFTDDGAITTVPLQFDPSGSAFVVFAPNSESDAPTEMKRNFPDYRTVLDVRGAWGVAFDPAWGGPAHIRFPTLIDWTQHDDKGIRYYSGTATYRK